MRNKTCENAAEEIIRSGCDKKLIVQALIAVHGQGYNSGYRAKTVDVRRSKTAFRVARQRDFRKHLDTIDDVKHNKWQ